MISQNLRKTEEIVTRKEEIRGKNVGRDVLIREEWKRHAVWESY
jgi:hypothetical protein